MFKMQVLARPKGSKYKIWVDCMSSEGRVYTFKTFEEAERMLKICYPEQCRFGDRSKVRVVEIE